MFRGEDRPERVSVIGTDNFIRFVETIRDEGVELEYAPMGPGTPAQSPHVIEVDHKFTAKDIAKLDIELPVLTPRVQRDYRVLEQLDPSHWAFQPVPLRDLTEEQKREVVITFREVDRDRVSHSTTMTDRFNPTIRSVIGFFADETRHDLRLIGGYDILHGKIKEFIAGHLFGQAVDLDDPNVLYNVMEIKARKTVLESVKAAINRLTIQDHGSTKVDRMMSFARDVRPHVVAYSRQYVQSDRSILNKVVGDSHFELEVAAFLGRCKGAISFLKNSQSTHFRIEYQNADGGIANYYPDFVVKQTDRDIWIIETKGREDLDDPLKWDRLKKWCEDASRIVPGVIYKALFIREEDWDANPPRDFRELLEGFAD